MGHSVGKKRGDGRGRSSKSQTYFGKALPLIWAGVFLFAIGAWIAADSAQAQDTSSKYVLIGWNDLGMHCINPTFKELAILPPANNLWAQVIKRGDPPQIVTTGVSLEYSIVKNTTVAGKTDFWQYVKQLFGVDRPEGIGLTGNGLSGKMQLVGDHFEATRIPLLPYDDSMNWNPYQTALVKLKDNSGNLLKTTKVVLPVSDELNCAKCHMQGMDGTVNLPNGGVESIDTNILAVHDFYHGANGQTTIGPNLMDSRPVLCAKCHPDNALGAAGDGTTRSLSQDMHGWHAQFPDAGCYDCHPGQSTQCFRTGIDGMGYSGDTPSCQTGLCHGGKQGVADSIAQGRQPWLQEPTCEQCHGINKMTGQDLYRNSKWRDKVYCVACHNSPHAWWPSKLLPDNEQPLALQTRASSISNCLVCHLTKPNGNNRNPHVTILKAPDIFATPTSLAFDPVKVYHQEMKTIKIANRGTSNLEVSGIAIDGLDASAFKIYGDTEQIVRPGGSSSRMVYFRPRSSGVKTATLTITTNDPDTPSFAILLNGTGY